MRRSVGSGDDSMAQGHNETFPNWPVIVGLLVILVGQGIGLQMFVEGFFPPSLYNNDVPDWPLDGDANSTMTPAKFDRLVFMVVDALRADLPFIDINNDKDFSGRMPFLLSLLRSRSATGFIAEAASPTVTLPRIKALLSGSLPSFFDVIENFDAKQTKLSTWVHEYRNSFPSNKIVFYGDDTWLNVLGTSLFDRYEGTSSFFVSDTVQVDLNVTRNVEGELGMLEEENGFDLMVLHYLGLDHIGHLQGPGSPLMTPKLKEMDKILEKIYEILRKSDEDRCRSKEHKDSCGSLVVLVSDHGMNNIGNHGGSSDPEKSTLLVFSSPKLSQSTLSHLQDTGPKTSKELFQSLDHCQQIDFAPTISFLMGLNKHPQHSVGRSVSLIDQLYTPQDTTRVHSQTCRQLLNLLASVRGLENGPDHSIPWFKDIESLQALDPQLASMVTEYHRAEKEQSREIFDSIAKEAADVLRQSLTRTDLSALFMGVVLLTLSALAFCDLARSLKFNFLNGSKEPWIGRCYSLIIVLFLIGSLPLFFGVDISPSRGFILWLLVSELATRSCSYSVETLGSLISVFKSRSMNSQWRWAFLWTTTGSVLMLASMGASSFVEEEHNTWYFLVSTSMVLFILQIWKKEGSKDGVWHVLVLLVAFRVMCNWNQTGSKWVDEMDIHKFLLRNNSTFVIQILLIIASNVLCQILLVQAQTRKTRKRPLDVVIGSILVILVSGYRIIQITCGTVNGMFMIARVCYVAILLQFLWKVISIWRRPSMSDRPIASSCLHFLAVSFLQLSLLIQKPLNSPVVICIGFLAHQLSSLAESLPSDSSSFGPFPPLHRLWKMIEQKTDAYQIVLIWFGNAALFVLGNSNSVSTVDISGAYTGVSEYNPSVVGALTFVILFGGPTIVFLFVLSSLSRSSCLPPSVDLKNHEEGVMMKKTKAFQKMMVAVRLGIWQSALNAVFCALVIFFRHHLFIWTVFCPKLFYVIGFSIFHLLFVLSLFLSALLS